MTRGQEAPISVLPQWHCHLYVVQSFTSFPTSLVSAVTATSSHCPVLCLCSLTVSSDRVHGLCRVTVFIDYVQWQCSLTVSSDSVHWLCPVTVFIDCVQWHYSLTVSFDSLTSDLCYQMLTALQMFGANLNDYLHMLLPPIVKLFDSSDIPFPVRKSVKVSACFICVRKSATVSDIVSWVVSESISCFILCQSQWKYQLFHFMSKSVKVSAVSFYVKVSESISCFILCQSQWKYQLFHSCQKVSCFILSQGEFDWCRELTENFHFFVKGDGILLLSFPLCVCVCVCVWVRTAIEMIDGLCVSGQR